MTMTLGVRSGGEGYASDGWREARFLQRAFSTVFALQALGGARVDVGDDAEGEETRKRAPVQILNEQDHGLLLLGMQCFALLEYGVDTGLALLLRLTLDRNADGKGGDHVLAMQHDIGQVHHGRYDLQCERKRSSAHLHRILLLVSGDAKSR